MFCRVHFVKLNSILLFLPQFKFLVCEVNQLIFLFNVFKNLVFNWVGYSD